MRFPGNGITGSNPVPSAILQLQRFGEICYNKIMETSRRLGGRKVFINTLLWGFGLWFFGYVLGIVFFYLVSQNMIGWFVLPLGIIAILWVLLKKIKRESFKDYVNLGIVWTAMAMVLDYVFIVKLFNSTDYYKPDVYLYYALTLILPLIVGWRKKIKSK